MNKKFCIQSLMFFVNFIISVKRFMLYCISEQFVINEQIDNQRGSQDRPGVEFAHADGRIA